MASRMTSRITCYLDFISPYAYLAFERVPRVLGVAAERVVYKPVLFAGMLKHFGQLGPAEVPGKREWTYRQVLWSAKEQGIAMDLPQAHPFNPLALLRLGVAVGEGGECPRLACERIFRSAWRGGHAADAPERIARLREELSPARDPASPDVKAELRANTDEAIAAGVFGVPTFVVEDRLFWGQDSLSMLRAFLDGDPWFGESWSAAADVARGVVRSTS